MKVIFVSPQLKSGGGNRVFIELANELIKSKSFAVEILYPNNSRELTHYYINPKINVVKLGNIASSPILKLKNMFMVYRELISALRCDKKSVGIISDPILCMFLSFVPKLLRPRVIRFVQSNDYHIFDDLYLLRFNFILKIFKYLTIISFKLNFKYVFVSNFAYEKFVYYSKRSDVKRLIINPSVNKQIFKEYPGLRSDEGINLCLVGRVHPLKRLDDFLEVWNNRLKSDIKNMVNHVWIISTENLARFNLNGIEIIKPKSDLDIAVAFNKSHIFISTSLWEGFSLPPLEAMHCGCAIISSKSGGINEYAEDRRNCLLYEPGNLNELKHCLEELIENPQLRKKITSNGQSTAKQTSSENMGRKWIEYLNKFAR